MVEARRVEAAAPGRADLVGLLARFAPLVFLIVLMAAFSFFQPRFLNPLNLFNVMRQVSVYGLLAIGMTFVILTAGIDLSIGVIMVISAVIMGNCAITYGIPTPIAVLAGMLVGGLCGLLNGFLVAFMKLPPFIVTLGTWNIVMATNFIYSANEDFSENPKPKANQSDRLIHRSSRKLA